MSPPVAATPISQSVSLRVAAPYDPAATVLPQVVTLSYRFDDTDWQPSHVVVRGPRRLSNGAEGGWDADHYLRGEEPAWCTPLVRLYTPRSVE